MMTITWIESNGDWSTGIRSVMRGLSSLIVATMRAIPQINVELGIRNEELGVRATDDCGIVHKNLPNAPIYIVLGEEQNKKITFKEDI